MNCGLYLSAVCPFSFSHFFCGPPSLVCLQLKATLTMDKVYLSLEMVGLSAEKTKLEHDFREGASQLRIMDVRAAKEKHRAALCDSNVRVFPQQRCSQLEQRKVQLTEQGKGQMKRAKSICNMQPNDSLSEELRIVSVYVIRRYPRVPSPLMQMVVSLVNAGIFKVARHSWWHRFHAEWGAVQSRVLHRPQWKCKEALRVSTDSASLLLISFFVAAVQVMHTDLRCDWLWNVSALFRWSMNTTGVIRRLKSWRMNWMKRKTL